MHSFFLRSVIIGRNREGSLVKNVLNVSKGRGGGPLFFAERLGVGAFFFLEAFCNISHRLCGITPFGVFSDAFPGLKMWVTFACATANFLTHFIISIAVLENVPLTQGYRKEPLFHTKRRYGRDRESNPGPCLAGSVTRRSAIHYAYRTSF
jgi:hypothetical protein